MPNLWIRVPVFCVDKKERFNYTNQLHFNQWRQHVRNYVLLNVTWEHCSLFIVREHITCGICSSNISLQRLQKWSDDFVKTVVKQTLLGVQVMAIDQNHTSKYRHIPTAQLRIDAMFYNDDLLFIHMITNKCRTRRMNEVYIFAQLLPQADTMSVSQRMKKVSIFSKRMTP